jgi:hypothetical protein
MVCKGGRKEERGVEGGNLPHAAPAESQITPQVASLIVWAFKMQSSPLHQPVDLQFDSRVDQLVKIPAGVFE